MSEPTQFVKIKMGKKDHNIKKICFSMKIKPFELLTVVFCNIGFGVVITLVLWIILPAKYALGTFNYIFNAILAVVLASSTFYFYNKAFFVGPGIVPHQPIPDSLLSEMEANPKNGDKFSNVCKYCNSLKPPRAHHCNMCGRCIPRMDHHCLWIGTCVGRDNQKYFIFWLIFYFAGAFYLFLHSLPLLRHPRKFNSLWKYSLVVQTAAIAFSSIVYCVDRLIRQYFNTTQNMTSVEREFAHTQKSTKGIQYENPFNKGNWKDNMKEVFNVQSETRSRFVDKVV